jgi:hypothetical protein
MDVALQSPSPPVNMLGDYVSSQETTITIQCHDRIFKDVTALGDDGQTLFKVKGTSYGKSWSWRRKIYDGAGRYVCDLRHHNFDIKNNGWVVEDEQSNKFCTLEHTAFLKKGHAAVTAKVRTTAGEDVTVEMEPKDRGALSTIIQVDGTTIATISKIGDNQFFLANAADRSVWQVRVAAGVDLSLVSFSRACLCFLERDFNTSQIMVIALCRAESSHVWKD